MRKKTGDIANDLPDGVLGPFFNDEFGDTFISLYAITGDGFSYPELKDFAKAARDHSAARAGRRKVDLSATRTRRSTSKCPRQGLAERGLSALDIQAALDGQNAM